MKHGERKYAIKYPRIELRSSTILQAPPLAINDIYDVLQGDGINTTCQSRLI